MHHLTVKTTGNYYNCSIINQDCANVIKFLFFKRHWANVNPNFVIQTKNVRGESQMVWAGMIGVNIIGPFFVDERVNTEVYLELLGDFILPRLQELNYDPEAIIYQHDGAPAHRSRDAVDWLDENMPQWIGTNGEIKWPPRSPDLTPLDFFVWPYVKHRVYQMAPETIEDLRECIVNVFDTITPEMLLNVNRKILKRLQLCIAVDGGHIEQLL